MTWRDVVAALSIPVIFLVGMVLSHLVGNEATGSQSMVVGLVDTAVRVLLCAVLIFAYRSVFAKNWAALRNAPIKTALIVLGGAIALQVVIAVVQAALPFTTGTSSAASTAASATADSGAFDYATMPWSQFAIQAVLMLGPVVTVFIEEVVFRYTFLQRLPIWSSRVAVVVAVVVNSVVFGAIHYYNFGGELVRTIPYMFAGLFMNLAYLWTRNVWVPALMHLVNNVMLTYGGLLLVAVVRIAGVGAAAGG